MTKLYIIGGIIAILIALYLVRGIVQAGAARQTAIAHKIEIRRENPIIRQRWRDRRKAALAAGQPFTEAEPDAIEITTAELKPGIPLSLGDIDITLLEIKP